MSPPPASPPIFRLTEALPRGPHHLSREEVAASQRARLVAATVQLVGERGYADVTVREIARLASVSAKTFYEQFDGKLACFLAGYDEFTRVLYTRMAPADPRDDDLASTVRRILTAYLRTMDENPLAARAFLVEMNAAGAAARARRREINATFAYGLRERHRAIFADDPGFEPPSVDLYRGIVHAIRELACDALEANMEQPLADMVGELVPMVVRALEPER